MTLRHFFVRVAPTLVACAITAAVAARCADDSAEVTRLKLNAGQQVAITRAVQGRLAETELRRDQYAEQLKAADKLNGELVVAIRLKVPRRDTLLVHDTLETTVMVDGSRRADFRDSTFAGVLHGTVTAPPYPAPLGLQYTLTRPAFSPSVGLVRVGQRFVATVEWQGEHVEVDAPYADAELVRPPRFSPWVELLTDPGLTLTARAGAQVRVGWGMSMQAALDQRFTTGESLRVLAGIRKEF